MRFCDLQLAQVERTFEQTVWRRKKLIRRSSDAADVRRPITSHLRPPVSWARAIDRPGRRRTSGQRSDGSVARLWEP